MSFPFLSPFFFFFFPWLSSFSAFHLSSLWHHHSVMFSTKKLKKKGPTHWPNVISFSLSFFFFLFPLTLISLLSASCPMFLSSLSALSSPISQRRWQWWRQRQIHEVWTRQWRQQLKTSPLWVLLVWVLDLDQCFSEGPIFWFLIFDYGLWILMLNWRFAFLDEGMMLVLDMKPFEKERKEEE